MSNAARDELVLILDFGSQYTQLLAQRVRENQVFCEIIPCSTPAAKIAERAPIGLILSGGAEDLATQVDPEIFKLGIPVLGVGSGARFACKNFGATAQPAESREYERAQLNLTADGATSPLFNGVSQTSDAWTGLGDAISSLSDDFQILATTPTCPNAAFASRSIPFWGIQFHPEVPHTTEGAQILKNFLFEICKASGKWTTNDFIATMIEKIRAQVGDERVVCGLSGGVDSAVVAALVSRAIGSNLTCIFVDTGLMRKNEIESVASVFRANFDANLVVVNAEDRFLTALAGVADPQQKRKIIGKLFIDVFSDEAAKIDGAKFLAQGTIYPDVVESGVSENGQKAATVKFHHNVGGLPEDLEFELVEPLRELFKGEVRQVGAALGLPENIVWRHPFPGPGLGVRCLGPLTKPALDTLREADAIVVEEIVAAGLYRETSQVFAVLLPVQSVGVKNGERTYENAVAVRCISTADFMTADWCRLPYEVLAKISSRIINEVDGINRVVYDISPKPPATIEWE